MDIAQQVSWSVTVDEANFILQVLGTRPFNEVNNLVSKLHQQGIAQLNPPEAPPAGNGSETPPNQNNGSEVPPSGTH